MNLFNYWGHKAELERTAAYTKKSENKQNIDNSQEKLIINEILSKHTEVVEANFSTAKWFLGSATVIFSALPLGIAAELVKRSSFKVAAACIGLTGAAIGAVGIIKKMVSPVLQEHYTPAIRHLAYLKLN